MSKTALRQMPICLRPPQGGLRRLNPSERSRPGYRKDSRDDGTSSKDNRARTLAICMTRATLLLLSPLSLVLYSHSALDSNITVSPTFSMLLEAPLLLLETPSKDSRTLALTYRLNIPPSIYNVFYLNLLRTASADPLDS